jgi:hypothetical protein
VFTVAVAARRRNGENALVDTLRGFSTFGRHGS